MTQFDKCVSYGDLEMGSEHSIHGDNRSKISLSSSSVLSNGMNGFKFIYNVCKIIGSVRPERICV